MKLRAVFGSSRPRRVHVPVAAALVLAASSLGLLAGGGVAVPVGNPHRGAPAVLLHARPVAATTATGQVTAHDGKFWLGSSQIKLHGVMMEAAGSSQPNLQQIASWGMNFVRFRVEWSQLEPTAPTQNKDGTWNHTWNTGYLGFVQQNVQWASQLGIYSVIANYACNDCSDYFRFPPWLYTAPYNSHNITYPQTDQGVLDAQTDFWSDPLRQQFETEFLKELATNLKGYAGLAGYEIMNEPAKGALDASHTTTQSMLDWQLTAAQAVRAIDPGRVIFFQTRAGFAAGLPNADLTGWAALGNVAFDLHDYFGGRWGAGLSTTGKNPGETLQVLYAEVVDDGVGPFVGTTTGKVRFLQAIMNPLGKWGIPLVVGEIGDVSADPAVYNYFGTQMSATNYLGVSWAVDYAADFGIVVDGQPKPWAYIVINAV
jgi:aryl-phospho-beta-D-glucosidase BglC (GH1 family)